MSENSFKKDKKSMGWSKSSVLVHNVFLNFKREFVVIVMGTVIYGKPGK